MPRPPTGRLTLHRSGDDSCDPLGGLVRRRVVEMDVAVGRACPTMPEQTTRDTQDFSVHHRVRGVRIAQVMQPCVRHHPGLAARALVQNVRRSFVHNGPFALSLETPTPRTLCRQDAPAASVPPRRAGRVSAPSSSPSGLGGRARLDTSAGVSPSLHSVSRMRRTASTQTGLSFSRWRGTTPNFARSSSPSIHPCGVRR